jgi:hydrogenase maturation protease
MRAVIIGVGNRYRCDDAAGPMALDVLVDRLPRDVAIIESDGEPSRLIDAWDGCDVAIVVEAVRQGLPGGSVTLTEVDPTTPSRVRRAGAGSHDLGLGDAIALGIAVGRIPRRLLIAGIEPEELGFGADLSEPVELNMAQLVRCAEEALHAEMSHVR